MNDEMTTLFQDPSVCSKLLTLLLTQTSTDSTTTNDLIGLSSHLISVWKCSAVDLLVFQTPVTQESSAKNSLRSLKLLLESPCTLINGEGLFKPLLELVKSSSFRLYRPAATVLGSLLTWLHPSPLYQDHVTQLHDLALNLSRDPVLLNQFIRVVHDVSKGHPGTAGRFQGQLLDNLGRTHGNPRGLVIETLVRSGDYPGVIVALDKIGFEKLMRDKDVQITVANALIKCVDSINDTLVCLVYC